MSFAGRKQLLIQSYLKGSDTDISILAGNGEILAYAIQKNTAEKNTFKYSKSIKFSHNEDLLRDTRAIIKDLNYSGIAHLDFRYDPINNTYQLIDFNARYWSSILGSLNAGINFPWLACQQALGISFAIPKYKDQKYFAGNNILKYLSKKIPLRFTELHYNFKDPFPFIIDIYTKICFVIKKLYRND